MRLSQLYPLLRQWLFAPEFRIQSPATHDPVQLLAASLEHNLRSRADSDARAQRLSAEVERLRKAAENAQGLPAELAIGLCNEQFRLDRNARQLMGERGESSELRGILRRVEAMKQTLLDHGVECLDLSGQDFYPERTDFEPLGPPELEVGLERPRIALCERPAVMLNGKLVQRAKGIVARPA